MPALRIGQKRSIQNRSTHYLMLFGWNVNTSIRPRVPLAGLNCFRPDLPSSLRIFERLQNEPQFRLDFRTASGSFGPSETQVRWIFRSKKELLHLQSMRRVANSPRRSSGQYNRRAFVLALPSRTVSSVVRNKSLHFQILVRSRSLRFGAFCCWVKFEVLLRSQIPGQIHVKSSAHVRRTAFPNAQIQHNLWMQSIKLFLNCTPPGFWRELCGVQCWICWRPTSAAHTTGHCGHWVHHTLYHSDALYTAT